MSTDRDLLRRIGDYIGKTGKWEDGSLIVDEINAALAQPEPEPDGWVLVPKEPTEAMLWAGHMKIDFDRGGQNTLKLEDPSQTQVVDPKDGTVLNVEEATTVRQDMIDAWEAMLAAAPKPEDAK